MSAHPQHSLSQAISREELKDRASDGDLDAQIALAEALDSEGAATEAAVWLAQAANSKHPYANALYGAWQILGHNVAADDRNGVERLRFAAELGESAACALLASLHACGLAVEQNWDRSLDWLTKAARLGNARALTQLGLLQPGGPLDGMRVALLWAAASREFDAAQYLLGRALLDAGDPQHRTTGVAWLQLARRAGNPCSFPAFADDEVASSLRGPVAIDTLPWHHVRERVDIHSFLAAPFALTPHHARPAIESAGALVPREFCDYLMGVAAPLLRRAEVNDAAQGGRHAHEMRTNSAMTFGVTNSDVILQIVNHRLARATDEPAQNQEDTAVLRYRPGETYESHFDFIDPTMPHFRRELEQRGQRIATALVYLNHAYEGGETFFPELKWRFKGTSGDALLWRNVQAGGAPEPLALHAGLPPTRGEKWILSKWIRSTPQLGGRWT